MTDQVLHNINIVKQHYPKKKDGPTIANISFLHDKLAQNVFFVCDKITLYALITTITNSNRYEKACFLNHSCKPNATWSFQHYVYPEGSGWIAVLAGRDIKAGEEVTIMYYYLYTPSLTLT